MVLHHTDTMEVCRSGEVDQLFGDDIGISTKRSVNVHINTEHDFINPNVAKGLVLKIPAIAL